MTDKLFNFIRARVRTLEDAEDIYQDTLLAAHKAAATFEGRSAFESWLVGISLNMIKNGYRRNRIEADVFVKGLESPDLAVDSDFSLAVSLTEILAKVMCLPDKEREVMCKLAEGYKYEELATLYHVPIGTIRSRAFRAREKLGVRAF
jgi:RNA polymerase sigma-70 factor (ECF subfamily)